MPHLPRGELAHLISHSFHFMQQIASGGSIASRSNYAIKDAPKRLIEPFLVFFLTMKLLHLLSFAISAHASALSSCPGYSASNVETSATGLTADLHLAGAACDAYGRDLDGLKLAVAVESPSRIHVKIYDAAEHVYQVPEAVFPRPKAGTEHVENADIEFEYTASPFSFRIVRRRGGEALFDSSAASLVFEDQFLRLRTKLPLDANVYGLGERSDSFRLATKNHTVTIWNADNPPTSDHRNIYGSHPMYLEHRESGSHGVFLLNSNGMDIHIVRDAEEQYLEYNAIGGVFDFYFLAGPSPVDVTKQYAEVAGLTTTVPYASLGFHNLRFGYRDAFEVAEVIANYSNAKIPLETQWVDIDYMDKRSVSVPQWKALVLTSRSFLLTLSVSRFTWSARLSTTCTRTSKNLPLWSTRPLRRATTVRITAAWRPTRFCSTAPGSLSTASCGLVLRATRTGSIRQHTSTGMKSLRASLPPRRASISTISGSI